MSARSQRGRPTPAKKQPSMLPLYLLIGVVALLAVALVALNMVQPAATSSGTANVDTATLASYPAKGNPDAPVTVIEYADYQCPSCAAYATGLGMQIDAAYIDTGKVRFIYHEMPLQQHALAIPAAETARAAGEQNKYWEMSNLLFSRQAEWTGLPEAQAKTRFGEYASELGLDVNAFNAVLQSAKHRPALQQAYNEALKANIPATPSFVIDGKIYGAQSLQSAIDAALKAKG